MFWSNTLAIPKYNVCTHKSKTSDTCHERWPTGEVQFGRVTLFGGSLVSEGRGLRELKMADGLVEVENRKCSGILEAGSTGARTLPMASDKVLSEIPIPSWLFAALETHRHMLDFLSTASLGTFEEHTCS